MQGIHNEHTVIVGAAEGMGPVIAQHFVQQGAILSLLDRKSSVKAVAQELGATGHVADVTDWDALQTVARACEETRPVTHVLYVVGMGSGKSGFPFWRLTPDDWPRVYQVNVQGAVHVVHAFVEPMVARGKGSFVLLSSVSGQHGARNDPPYSAAKAALINFGQIMALDLAPHGLRANLIAPGIVDTPMQYRVYEANTARLDPEERPDYMTWMCEKLARLVPLNRPQTADDIAQAALYLCSEAARNVTGQVLNVDGGWIMKG